MPEAPTYVFAGGGSGGHLFPGIAIADELVDRDPTSQILFVGTDRRVERRIIAVHGYDHMDLSCESFASFRKNPVRFGLRFWKSCRQARLILEQERPRAVFGLGGYASAPAVIAGSSLGIPTILLEQNAVAGRATRWLSGRASLICLSFDDTRGRFSSRANLCVTGNPVRREISRLTELPFDTHEDKGSTTTILVLGGSQGATAVNEIMLHVAEGLSHHSTPLQIVHQTGEQHCDAVRDAYDRLAVDALVQPFFADLIDYYRRADIVVSRAGATTLAELACVGCPAILVPYPHSADDHQQWNARLYETVGAAHLVEQTPDLEAAAAEVREHIERMLRDQERASQMRRRMRSQACPRATADVVDRLEQVIAEKDVVQPALSAEAAVVGDR